jgi:hypothetical protein
MNPRALRSLTIAAFIMTLLWALVIAVRLSRAELPAGMHRASIVRADTVIRPHRTPLTDTLERLDSIIRVRQERKNGQP